MMREPTINSQKFGYLQFVEFKDFGFWDAKRYANNSLISENHGLVKMAELLKKQRSKLQIQNDQLYKQLTIRLYGNGATLRKEEFGKNIKTKSQYVVRSGQLVFSRIDARSGAFGIVPADLDGAIVSNDFPVYSIKSDIVSPAYLQLVISSSSFSEICKSKSSGTTGRRRMSENDFESIKIPLPPLLKQQELITTYNQKLLDAETKEQKANQLEKSIDEYLIEELGIELPKTALQQSGFLKLTDFKNLSRWDVWALGKSGSSKKYDNLPFKDVVIGKPMYGANTKTLKQKTDVRYIRITDINEDGSLEQEIVSPLKFEEKYLLQENDFLIARSGNTVGKTFLYKKNFGRCCFAGYLVKYKIDESKILPEFLLYYTKSKIFKNWINSNQRVAGQPNINGQEYLIFPVVLPPFEIQNKIVAKITLIKEEIKTLRQEAQKLKAHAKEEFEKEVFN